MEFNPSGYRGDPGIPHSDTKTFGYLLACSNVSLGEHNMAKEAALLSVRFSRPLCFFLRR